MAISKAEWADKRKEIRKRDGNICQMCGTEKDLSIHHIVPRSVGGGNENHNLITLCNDCHEGTHRAYRTGYACPDTFWTYLRAMRLSNDLPEEV